MTMARNMDVQCFAYRANIVRYRKILTTYLTTEERRFVERRLSEEQAALTQLLENTAATNKSNYVA